MKDTLKPGLTVDFAYRVSRDQTVPKLFPDIQEAQVMPRILATGFLVGLLEFACIRAIKPHIDWPREQSVGIAIDIRHLAPTPPGFTVKIQGTLEGIKGRKLTFSLKAYDGVDKIAEGTHVRYIIDERAFTAHADKKAAGVSPTDP